MTTKDSTAGATPETKAPRRKKDLPSVDYLLKHGDPETAHLPKTWCEIIGYPFVLALVFAISLMIFHNAPWDSLPPRQKQSVPLFQKMKMFKEQQARAKAGIPNVDPAATEL